MDLASGDVRRVPVGTAPRKVVLLPASPRESAAPTVTIAQFAFAPAELRVARGSRVTWRNDDGAPHGLKHKDGAAGLPLMLPGGTATRVYETPGVFDYECAVHPYMTGRVVVSGD